MQNLHCKLSLGKPLLEVCWFYMVIAQIALQRPALCQTANVEKSKYLGNDPFASQPNNSMTTYLERSTFAV